MDVNGSGYFLLRGEADFRHGSSRFRWDRRRGAFLLRQRQALRLPAMAPGLALDAWRTATPLVRDPFSQIAVISGDGRSVQLDAGRGFEALLDGELQPLAPPAGVLSDLSLGGDGRLVAAYSNGADRHGLLLFHLGRRWQTRLAPELPAAAVRAVVDGDNRVWCVTETRLLLCVGEPLPHPYQPLPARFEPVEINPHPFTVLWSQDLPAGRLPMALCADRDRVYLLSRPADEVGPQVIHTRARNADRFARWTHWPLEGNEDSDIPFVVDMGLIGDSRIAIPAPREPGDLAFERRDCPVVALEQSPRGGRTSARLVGERYPMRSQRSPRLVSALDSQVRYQADPTPGSADSTPYPRELHALPRPVFAAAAQVTPLLGSGDGLDSGRPDTAWHRVYIDGCIPSGCRLTLMAKAYNSTGQRAATPFQVQPQPLWSPLASELPYHDSLAPSKPGESGLFEVLLQYPEGQVRTLTGRYLQLRLRMEGDGRHTPAVHALRVYMPRFSYQETYLPELFRQRGTRAPGDDTAPANGADVRERLLAAFEGMLTPIEGRIAASDALLHPNSAPPHLLPRLAASLGVSMPEHWPLARRRRQLEHGCLLQRWRGTYLGVHEALDIATGGAVARGQVVLVENFRLRRTFATILGLDMDDRDHPLTLGTGISGNSIVGDSLILSDEDSRTFLALLAPDLVDETGVEGDAESVRAFFDRYSHRVSVLLHGPARRERVLVEEVLGDELPAHLEWRIIETDHPFVLGLAPLLAVDSYLEVRPEPRRVRLDDTYLGREGILANPVALSPRDLNSAAAGPVNPPPINGAP